MPRLLPSSDPVPPQQFQVLTPLLVVPRGSYFERRSLGATSSNCGTREFTVQVLTTQVTLSGGEARPLSQLCTTNKVNRHLTALYDGLGQVTLNSLATGLPPAITPKVSPYQVASPARPCTFHGHCRECVHRRVYGEAGTCIGGP